MRNFIYIFFFVFIHISIVRSADYFIRLSEEGLKHRHNLLNYRYDQVFTYPASQVKNLNSFKLSAALRSIKNKTLFHNWLILKSQEKDAGSFLELLHNQGLIDYSEPIGHFRTETISTDSLAAKQWYLQKINLSAAWNVTRGSADVIIAIIDTGIDYTHPDLKENIWENEIEKYGTSGVDDDNNGFVDDSLGWDFTDAPSFADGGDYRDPDNDPMDEFGAGHGTQVAGIIASVEGNSKGITGIAPKTRIMNLRAGTASGYLEEDDVAKAVIYAVENRARIINMSFGDVALSRYLKDVIYYAYGEGVIMAASAGNSASNEIHYPSGLAETISVGASNETDQMAGFSNFGPTIDLLAPGVNMLSTAIGGAYNYVNGTSFSAPVVSAVCALILSQYPEYSVERVRNLLKTSSEDILYPGWDQYSGAGRVSAGNALSVKNSGMLRLIYPQPNSGTAEDTLLLTGTIIHPDITQARVDYGVGMNPGRWENLLLSERRQVLADTLGMIDLRQIPDTLLNIRMQMTLLDGSMDEQHALIYIDRTAPRLSQIEILPLYDGSSLAQLISFKTDDICSARMHLKKEGESSFSQSIGFGYETKNHRLKLNENQYEGEYIFYIEVTNSAGLTAIDDNNGQFYSFKIYNQFVYENFTKVDWQLPAGYLLDKTTDFDHDGKKEIVLSRYDQYHSFGPVEIYEFETDHFEKRFESSFTAIPRDAGDVDGDGLSDLLLGFGQLSFVLESESVNTFPQNIIWQDTSTFWGAAFADTDQDGKGEIIGRIDSQYVILEHEGLHQFTESARLSNPSPGDNLFGVPEIELSDVDGDQKADVIFGDYDGDIIIYKSSGDNLYELLTYKRAIDSDATETISALDIPAAPNALFVSSHSSDNLNYEHEFDARRRSVERFEYDANQNMLTATDTITVFGYRNSKEFDSGLSASYFNNEDLLFLAFYPDLYIFKLESGKSIPVWHKQDARSNTIIIDDFDGDGSDEFYYNNGTEICGWTKSSGLQPAAPWSFMISQIDSVRISMKWEVVPGVNHYNIYRGFYEDSLHYIAQTEKISFTDSGLIKHKKYYYAVSAIDSAFILPQSPMSNIDTAYTADPPLLMGASAVNERQLLLEFNEKVSLSESCPFIIRTKTQNQYAASALVVKNGRFILAGFTNAFIADEKDSVIVKNVFNRHRIFIDLRYNSIEFIWKEINNEPYISEIKIADRYHIHLTFNKSMDRQSIINTDNYLLEPSGIVKSVMIMDSLAENIELTLSAGSMAGSGGEAAYLILRDIKSADGSALRETSKISLNISTENLHNLLIYPQPLKPEHRHLMFANVPENAQINIYNIRGVAVKKLQDKIEYGGMRWDLTDNKNETVHSGIYIYEVIHENEKKYGKIAIVR